MRKKNKIDNNYKKVIEWNLQDREGREEPGLSGDVGCTESWGVKNWGGGGGEDNGCRVCWKGLVIAAIAGRMAGEIRVIVMILNIYSVRREILIVM